MKCKKYDQSWFDNKYIQLLNMNCGTTEKKITKIKWIYEISKET